MEVLDSFQTSKAPARMFSRAVAFLIDVAILIAIERIAAKITGSDSSAFILESIIGALYYGVLEGGVAGNASVGKRVMKLRVCDLDGNDIGLVPALIRGVLHNLSAVIFFIGYFMAFFSERGQTLHDRIAGTMVVDAD